MKTPVEGIRASDTEREQIAKLLQAAAGEGRLTPEEAGERLAQASSARYRDDLEGLVADLPPVTLEVPIGRPPRRAFWLIGGAIRAAAFVGLMVLVWLFAFWPLGLIGLFAFIAVTRARFRWRAQRWGTHRGSGWVAVVR
jgi:hypothetical protein